MPDNYNKQVATAQNAQKAASGPDDYPGRIWDFLIGKGIGSLATAAIMGNIYQESKYNPAAVNSSSGAKGICQWLYGRETALMSVASGMGKEWQDLDVQLAHLWNEIGDGGAYNSYLTHIMSMTDLNEATIYWEKHFEVSGDTASYATRQAAAKDAFEKQGKGIPVGATYTGSGGSGGRSSDSGFDFQEMGDMVTIIKLPKNKTFCEPIYPDLLTVSDTIPKWALDMTTAVEEAEAQEKLNSKENTRGTPEQQSALNQLKQQLSAKQQELDKIYYDGMDAVIKEYYKEEKELSDEEKKTFYNKIKAEHPELFYSEWYFGTDTAKKDTIIKTIEELNKIKTDIAAKEKEIDEYEKKKAEEEAKKASDSAKKDENTTTDNNDKKDENADNKNNQSADKPASDSTTTA